MKLALNTIAVLGAIVVMWIAGARIGQWERAHGYPFGQMCNSVFTGWVNTCP